MKIFKKTLPIIVLGGFLLQTLGCGTILYPERKGQKGGRIDVGVAVLDAVGLIFFIIPGVIAFAVDFSTGAIYLPPNGKHSLSDGNARVVTVNPDELTSSKINEIVERETGIRAPLGSGDIKAVVLNGTAGQSSVAVASGSL